jgi:NAD(P)-dependent dehydrogenase (short-subunit alcohol dehydrogenase family)
MKKSLDGKIALVTGASRGIGRAIAQRLAADGAMVVVHYGNSRTAAEETAKAITEAGGRTFILRADVSKTGEINAMFDAFDRESGGAKIDILVNNAGIGTMADTAATDEALYDKMMATNVKGPFFITRQALPRLQDGGRIINISSMVSVVAYAACNAYAMSKAAINHFTRSLAAELGPRGITVNAVAPGATQTEFGSGLMLDPDVAASLAAGAALGRIGQPSDIASVVAFLASADGGWVTGQMIQASGGMHL